MRKTEKPESSQYLFMAYSILDVVSKYSNANVLLLVLLAPTGTISGIAYPRK